MADVLTSLEQSGLLAYLHSSGQCSVVIDLPESRPIHARTACGVATANRLRLEWSESRVFLQVCGITGWFYKSSADEVRRDTRGLGALNTPEELAPSFAELIDSVIVLLDTQMEREAQRRAEPW